MSGESKAATPMRLLGQKEAIAVDEELMSPTGHGFYVEQLMELAGLSVACAIAEKYSPADFKYVLVICGPGNNGGDGIVAARHLVHFGFRGVHLFYPKAPSKELYKRLIAQAQHCGIPLLDQLPTWAQSPRETDERFIVVDAIFGFSFDAKATIRPPYDSVIQWLVKVPQPKCPIVSVDIPSGWDVEQGDTRKLGLSPDMLVSLTAPKLCARFFTGRFHFLGGRFVPPDLAAKYGLNLPPYPGTKQAVELPVPVVPLEADSAAAKL